MIRLGNHLSQASKAKLVQIILVALLKETPQTIKKKLGIDSYSIYAIRRAMTHGTAGYARSTYKGEKSYTEIQKDFAGQGSDPARRSIQEAYQLVGGKLVDLHTIDLSEFVNPNPQKTYVRKTKKQKETDPIIEETASIPGEKGKERAAEFIEKQKAITEWEKNKANPINITEVSYEKTDTAPKNTIVIMERTTLIIEGRTIIISKPKGSEITITI